MENNKTAPTGYGKVKNVINLWTTEGRWENHRGVIISSEFNEYTARIDREDHATIAAFDREWKDELMVFVVDSCDKALYIEFWENWEVKPTPTDTVTGPFLHIRLVSLDRLMGKTS